MTKTGKAAAHDGKAAVVVVVSEETGLPSPHGIEIARLKPFLVNRFNVDVSVWREVRSIFPVFCIEDFRNRVGWPASYERFQNRVKEGIPHDQIAILMILMPASAPVSDHDLRLAFSNSVTNSQRTFLVERYLGVRIVEEESLRPEQACRVLGSRSLHSTVLENRNALRSSVLSQ